MTLGVAEATVSAAVRHLAQEGLAVRVKGLGSFVAKKLPLITKCVDLVRLQYMPGSKPSAASLKWIEELTEVAAKAVYATRWHHISTDDALSVDDLPEWLGRSHGVITLFGVSPKLPLMLWRQGIPVVSAFLMLGGLGDRPEPYPQITYDRVESARLATEHLVSLGHSRIGFVGLRSSPMRSVGFLETIATQKIGLQPEWIINLDEDIYEQNGPSGCSCKELVQRALKGPDRPQAFCCSTLRTAYAAVHAAEELGLNVPQDLAVVACDEAQPETNEALQITAVAVSRRQVCEKAFELLEQVGPEQNGTDVRMFTPTVMPLHLSIGDTCGAKLNDRAKQNVKKNTEYSQEMKLQS